MKKRSNSIMGRIICMPATSESNPYNLTKTVDFVNLLTILYMYEATTQLPLLVACEHIVRGAWRANSETVRMVSLFVLIPVFPNTLHSKPASLQSKEVVINALFCVRLFIFKLSWAYSHVQSAMRLIRTQGTT